jgi:hypothetical protein
LKHTFHNLSANIEKRLFENPVTSLTRFPKITRNIITGRFYWRRESEKNVDRNAPNYGKNQKQRRRGLDCPDASLIQSMIFVFSTVKTVLQKQIGEPQFPQTVRLN